MACRFSQLIPDLKASLHTLAQLTEENLLQVQKHQSRLYNQTLLEFHWAPNYLPSDKDLQGYTVIQGHRGNANR